ncbi:nucleoside diphosphate kinase [Aureococcus anophagefferens]|nr:nucleoside diphosphate kinase [Aureococcus anophagefferens]
MRRALCHLAQQRAQSAPTRAVTAPTRRLCTAPPRAVEHDGTLAQRTLVLLKPDAVERRLVGRLLQRFEDRGLALVGLRQRVAPRSLAEAHYDEHRAKPSSSARLPRRARRRAALEGRGAIGAARALVGPTDPVGAPPGTIRGDFGSHWRRNLVRRPTRAPAALSSRSGSRRRPRPAAAALEPWVYETPGAAITFD